MHHVCNIATGFGWIYLYQWTSGQGIFMDSALEKYIFSPVSHRMQLHCWKWGLGTTTLTILLPYLTLSIFRQAQNSWTPSVNTLIKCAPPSCKISMTAKSLNHTADNRYFFSTSLLVRIGDCYHFQVGSDYGCKISFMPHSCQMLDLHIHNNGAALCTLWTSFLNCGYQQMCPADMSVPLSFAFIYKYVRMRGK